MRIRKEVTSVVSSVAVLATLVVVAVCAWADPVARHIEWNTYIEGSSVVTHISSGGFRLAGDTVEIVDTEETVVVRVSLTFRLAGRAIPIAADIGTQDLRLTPDRARVAALGLLPVSPVPLEVPVVGVVSSITGSARATAADGIPGSASLGTAIGTAMGGAIGFAAGCALGALGTGAAVGAAPVGVLAVGAAIVGCITHGAAIAGTVGTVGGVVGTGVGVAVGALWPA